MVYNKKSVSLKPGGWDLESQTTDIVDLESTVNIILTTQLFVWGMWIEIRWMFH